MKNRTLPFAALCATVLSAGMLHAEDFDALGVQAFDSGVKPAGVFANIVKPGGPLAAAGVVPGDIITGIDGHDITHVQQLKAYLAGHKAGDKVALHVAHYGNTLTSDIKVSLAEDTAPMAVADAVPAAAPPPVPAERAAGVHKAALVYAPRHETAGAVHWARYADPAEHAFTIEVPAGWRISGGSRRMSMVEIRSGVDAVSPDGSIHLFYGDLNVPIFTPPSRMLAMGGMRTGMTYNPGQGVHLLIAPYMNGEAFAKRWGGAKRMAQLCSGYSPTGSHARADSSQAISSAYANGGIRTSVLAGEASFSCGVQGQPGKGYVFAATERVRAQMSELWDVKSLVGFTATDARAGEAYALLSHMVGSFAIDSNWQSRQNQNAASFERITAESNAAISSAIAANGRAQEAASNAIIARGNTLDSTSDMIVKGGAARANATSNAIDHYDEYAVRGTSTYTSASGTEKTLDNSYAHQYINNSGQTLSTDSENAPGAGWQEMQHQ